MPFVRKNSEVDAIQFMPDNLVDVINFLGPAFVGICNPVDHQIIADSLNIKVDPPKNESDAPIGMEDKLLLLANLSTQPAGVKAVSLGMWIVYDPATGLTAYTDQAFHEFFDFVDPAKAEDREDAPANDAAAEEPAEE